MANSIQPAPVRRLVGRGQQLTAISDQLVRASTGHGGIVLVDGEPGVGKTSLLDEAVRGTERARPRVLTSAANELEMRMPFGAIRPWLSADRLSGETASPMAERARAMLRGEGAGDGSAVAWEISVIDVIVGIFESLCATGPILLVMDDAHWADPSSLRAVARLHELTDELPLLIVLALRPLPRTDALTDLLGQLSAAGATRVPLGPLTDRDSADLAADMLGAPAGPVLARALTWAAGNPLFITELVTGMQQAGQLTVVPDGTVELATAAAGDDPRLPASLTEAILRRLNYLPTNARRVLSLAAALGVSVDAGELTAVLGAKADEIDNVVSLATEARVLSPGRDRLVRTSSDHHPPSNRGAILMFRHDLIRRVLATQVPKVTQASLQSHAAQTLMGVDGPAERIAEYLISGGGRLDPNGIAWLMKSANRLMICAPENAVRLLSDAIGSTTDAKSENLLRLLLVRALLWDGRAVEAEKAAREALERRELRGKSGRYRSVLLLLLSMASMAQGKVQAAHDVSIGAVRELSVLPALEARHQGMLALESLLLNNVPAAEHAADRAQTLGHEISDPVSIGMARFSLGFIRYYQCRLDECLRLGDSLIQHYESQKDNERFSHFNPYTVSGQCLMQLDRLETAEQILTAAVDYEDRSGGTMQTSNLVALGLLHFVTGRWDDASTVLTRCGGTADVLGYATVAPSVTAMIAVCQGTFTEAPTSIPELADDIGARAGSHVRAYAEALALEAHGNPAAALDLLVRACAEAEPQWTDITLYYIYPDMARLAVLSSRSADLQTIADDARAAEARIATPSRRATALLCTGLVTRDPVLLAESAELFTTAGRPMYAGLAYENLAAVQAEAGQTASARTALDAAVELYSGMDAEWLMARAEAWLRRLGLRYGRRGPRKRPKSGWAALTPSELRVAEFVTQGMSNSQIATRMLLSRRTVQTHVSSILTKLDIDSRVQIVLSHARGA